MRCVSEADFLRIWTKNTWIINKLPMHTFRWSLYFHVNKETSLAPVWFSLPVLLAHLFDNHCLFSIARVIGKPLFIDTVTTCLIRSSVVRICVEVDSLKAMVDLAWIGLQGENVDFWQLILFENLPSYYSSCWKVGHSNDER